MPELLRKQVSSRSTRVPLLAWTLAVLPALTILPALAAESLPASVRACAAETDSLRRLVCYDREVARFPAPTANAASAPQVGGTIAPRAQTASPSQPASAASSVATSPAPTPQAAPPTQTAATTGAPPAVAADASASAGDAKRADPTHVTARVVSIDHRPNELSWHLDNGQVWQEVQSVAGDLSLREGDTVKIDKHLGAYWLSGPHVASMRVRQKN
jgi:hypothetical protein